MKNLLAIREFISIFATIMKKTVLLILTLTVSLALSAAKTLTSADLKLVADGKTLNTVALQQAIDQLSKKGGGCITLTAGK